MTSYSVTFLPKNVTQRAARWRSFAAARADRVEELRVGVWSAAGEDRGGGRGELRETGVPVIWQGGEQLQAGADHGQRSAARELGDLIGW